MGEDTIETVKREMEEELGEKVQVERLLWCNENFFTLSGKRFHEIGFYYLVNLPDSSPLIELREFERKELDGTPMFFRWVDLNKITEMRLNPVSIKERIPHIGKHTEHIIEYQKN